MNILCTDSRLLKASFVLDIATGFQRVSDSNASMVRSGLISTCESGKQNLNMRAILVQCAKNIKFNEHRRLHIIIKCETKNTIRAQLTGSVYFVRFLHQGTVHLRRRAAIGGAGIGVSIRIGLVHIPVKGGEAVRTCTQWAWSAIHYVLLRTIPTRRLWLVVNNLDEGEVV